jgi:hypothetical protein
MTTPERFTVLDGGPSIEEREERLAEGADLIVDVGARRSIVSREHFLLVVAGALMAIGIAVILIGWDGAANTTLLEEQVPYLISGGLLGLALATIGALTFFSHWLTVSIREARRHEAARRQDHDELMGALWSIAGSLAEQEDQRNGRARSTRSERPLRGSPRGS